MKRLMSQSELRRKLKMAFHEGRIRGKYEMGASYPYTPSDFDEWYEEAYGGPDCE